MRAIDADVLFREMEKAQWYNNADRDEIAEELVLNAPTIEPQRTGRWIFDENDFLTKCSECGCHPWFGVIPTAKEATIKLPHCPMCLAKMGENNESD